MLTDNFFSIEKLDYDYQQRPILHQLNFSLMPGECVALLGPSGVGKSTLLHIIAGLLPAETGIIRLNDKILTEDNKHIIPCEKREMSMVFQDYALFPQLRVWENIAFGLEQHKFKREAIQERVQSLLALMHMESLGDRYPHELSGGQQQRVALARALAVQPKLLLLDEPFANIDTSVRVKLHAELQRIISTQKLSVLLVTHDRQEAFALANRVGILVPTPLGAQLAQLAKPIDIYQRPANALIAKLTGPVNLFPGHLKEREVETALGKWPCHGIRTGEGMVVTRPEQLEFIPTSSGKNRIVSKQFIGSGFRLVVESAAGILMIDAPVSMNINTEELGEIKLKEPAWFITD